MSVLNVFVSHEFKSVGRLYFVVNNRIYFWYICNNNAVITHIVTLENQLIYSSSQNRQISVETIGNLVESSSSIHSPPEREIDQSEFEVGTPNDGLLHMGPKSFLSVCMHTGRGVHKLDTVVNRVVSVACCRQ